MGVDAEGALRRTCDRFARNYAAMEEEARARDLDLTALSAGEQADLWQEVRSQT